MGIRMKTNHNRLYGLNLSRCLGDKFLKNEDLGLSAEPFVSPTLHVEPGQRGIALIASDGLWDVMEPPTAMQVLQPFSGNLCYKASLWALLCMQSLLCIIGSHKHVLCSNQKRMVFKAALGCCLPWRWSGKRVRE